jgi:hypothetical protein
MITPLVGGSKGYAEAQQFSQELWAQTAPDPPFYHDGKWLYLPVPGCERAMNEYLVWEDRNPNKLEVVCLCCRKRLTPDVPVHRTYKTPLPQDPVTVFGRASDHVRTTVNHLVIVYQGNTILWHSEYRLLATVS